MAAGATAPSASADAWLARVAWAVVAFSCAQILLFAFGRDQGIYAAVADAMLGGGMPYRDAWDFKPPGIYFVFALAQALFGKAMVSIRILECAGILVLVLAWRSVGRTLFGSARVGLVGGALAALTHAEFEFWHTAQPESFGAVVTAVAIAVAVGPAVRADTTRSRRAGAWVIVGGLFGIAFLLKPPLGGGAIPVAVYVAWAEWGRARRIGEALVAFLLIGAASVLPILLCGLWFWARGAWPAMAWTLFEFTPGYTRLGWSGTPLGLFLYACEDAIKFTYLLAPAAALGVLLPSLSSRERGGQALVVGVFAVHAAGIAMQAKFFQYHYGATLPLLCLGAGLGLYKVWLRIARWGPVALVAYGALVAVAVALRVAVRDTPGTFWERSADRLQFLVLRQLSREELDRKLYYVSDYDFDVDRKTARRVAGLTGPEDCVFVWGFEPVIYWLSGRAPASRYIYDVPQRAMWERDGARRQLMEDLAKSKPRVVVVQHGDYFRHVTGDDLDSYAALATFPELERLLAAEFRFAEPVEDMDVYVRR